MSKQSPPAFDQQVIEGGERLFIFQRTLNFPLTLALFYNLTFVVLFLTASEAELKL